MGRPKSSAAGGAGLSSPAAASYVPPSPYSTARSMRAHDDDRPPLSAGSAAPAPYSSGYSSFPIGTAGVASAATQSPPPTASTMRPSFGGLLSSAASIATGAGSSTAPPRHPIAFSHDDTEKSRLAYETLAASAMAYRVALGQLSAAASDFGSALEACARLKEARAQPYPPGPYSHGGPTRHDGLGDGGGGIGSGVAGSLLLDTSGGASLHEASCTADVLLATSGLYYLMANQQGILAETVYRSFEVPLVHELDRYAADVEAEQESYAAGMREASREIRRLEKEGVQLRKPRQRDVGRMRNHLVTMTAALDALTARQADHAVALLDQSRDMSGAVSQASRNLVRAEVDILDSLARKGWPGGGLDVVLDGAVDLFSRDADDDNTAGEGLLGGMTNGVGISMCMGMGLGIGRSLGPKPLLSGGGGDDDDDDDDDHAGGDDADDDDDADADADNDDVDGLPVDDTGVDADDDESEVSTINGNSRDAGSSSGGGFFSRLTGGGGTAALPDPARSGSTPERRSRRTRRQPRSGHKTPHDATAGEGPETAADKTDAHAEAEAEAEAEAGAHMDAKAEAHVEAAFDGSTAAEDAASHGRPRSTRADSLSVDTSAYQHQYQSLNSLASDTAAGTSSTTHSRDPSASRQRTAVTRGRSRPFSPQRVSVDLPDDDVFTGGFSGAERAGLARVREGGVPAEADGVDGIDEDAGSSRGKGKGRAPAAVTASSTPSSSLLTPVASAVDDDQEPDEGVHAWRQEV